MKNNYFVLEGVWMGVGVYIAKRDEGLGNIIYIYTEKRLE